MKSGAITHLAALAVVVASVPGSGYGQTDTAAPIDTTLCELKQAPEEFNGKMIRVRATIVSGFEVGGLNDKSCDAFLLLDVDGFRDLEKRAGEFAFIRSPSEADHPKRLKWRRLRMPSPVEPTHDASYGRYRTYQRQRFIGEDGGACFRCPLFELTATVVGRFDWLEQLFVAYRENQNDKPSVYGVGFGHLNASRTRLVWQSVSDVVATPIDPAIYQSGHR